MRKIFLNRVAVKSICNRRARTERREIAQSHHVHVGWLLGAVGYPVANDESDVLSGGNVQQSLSDNSIEEDQMRVLDAWNFLRKLADRHSGQLLSCLIEYHCLQSSTQVFCSFEHCW